MLFDLILSYTQKVIGFSLNGIYTYTILYMHIMLFAYFNILNMLFLDIRSLIHELQKDDEYTENEFLFP